MTIKDGAATISKFGFNAEMSVQQADSLMEASKMSAMPRHSVDEDTVSGGSPDHEGTRLRHKFQSRAKYETNAHQDILCLPKPEYQGKDFFQR